MTKIRARSLSATVAGLCLVAVTTTARADETPAPVPLSVERATAPAVGLKQVVKLDPVAFKLKRDRARVLYLEGKRYRDARAYDRALQALQRAYMIEPLPELLFEMAACFARAGQMKRALRMHRRYVARFRKPSERLVAAARFGEVLHSLRAESKAAIAQAKALPGT